ncbi:MAG: RnfABCDGE type electron transport complex subunit D [Pseudomonadota bacterium]
MAARHRSDPRHWQIAILSLLLGYGVVALGFEFDARRTLLVIVTCLVVQWLGGRHAGLERYDARSALITAGSLTLLLRTSTDLLAIAAAVLAIGSKFALRRNGRHIFNPANFALVALMLVTDDVWVSSGQWGSGLLLATALGALGLLVLNRARRAETTLAFIATFAALATGRALILGDPLAIAVLHLQNGALLVFAFFMISDPRTTPNAAPARVLYGAFVAAVGYVIQFHLFVPAGPVWALALAAPLVVLLDRHFPGGHYRWAAPRAPAASSISATRDVSHA